MTVEIRLVQEIQKHPCLYNNNLPEYNRKDLSEEAWTEVAIDSNLTVSECKEKWRNIRCSFLRSLKPSGKIKKPYYLTEYLQFILPFMKSLHYLDTVEDTQKNLNEPKNNSNEIVLCAVKSEPEADFDVDVDENIGDNEISAPTSDNTISETISPTYRSALIRKRRRHTNTITSFKTVKNVKRIKQHENTINLLTGNTDRVNNNAMRYFLMSLLPELETMTDEQIRLFKIKVMLLLDEIKTNDTNIRQSLHAANDSQRVQKRLINLLIRNLRRRNSS